MRTVKKALGIVLVLAMLLNVVALVSYAAVPADKLVELTLKADKTVYAPGDEIVLTAYAQTAPECQTVALHAQYEIAYNSSGIEPYSTSTKIADHGVVFDEEKFGPVDHANSEFVPWDVMKDLIGVTADSGCDQVVRYTISQDERHYNPSVDAPLELFSFKMKVSETAADGDYVIAFNQESYDNYSATLMASFAGDGEEQELMGPTAQDYGLDITGLFACGSVTIPVSSAPVVTGPSVAKAGAHVKFELDETGEAVRDGFKLRIKSKISATDWDTYFGSTTDDTATKNKITAVGMVAFPDVEFDKAAAMTAIENINNPEYTGEYKAASTTYIQKVDADSDAYFGAIINLSHEETKNANLRYIGYVQYIDSAEQPQTIFYATDYVANISDPNYGNLVGQVLPSQA